MKLNKILLGISIVIAILLIAFVGMKFYPSWVSEKGFDVNPVVMKSSIKQWETSSNTIKIENLELESQSFEIKVEDLEDFVTLGETSFELAGGHEKEVEIVFSNEDAKPFGVYVGYLVVASDVKAIKVPVILEVQTRNLLYTTNLKIDPDYKKVSPGEQFYVSVGLFNLNDTKAHSVEVTYSIRDFEGKEIFSDNEKVTAGTEYLFTKTFEIPKDAKPGDYSFSVVAEFEDSVGTSSELFTVESKKTFLQQNTFTLIVLAFIFGIIVLVFYIMHERDKLLSRLSGQQQQEIVFNVGKIKEQKESLLAKAEPGSKKEIIDKFRKLEKGTVKKLRRKHKKQKSIVRKLKKQKREKEIRNKLTSWKKQGFRMYTHKK